MIHFIGLKVMFIARSGKSPKEVWEDQLYLNSTTPNATELIACVLFGRGDPDHEVRALFARLSTMNHQLSLTHCFHARNCTVAK